ncbi:9020f4f8-5cef-4532-9d75-499ace2b52cc [Sclerotinia trifoliorum]|uniref:9020f4f8-5cef-4532-9d75-499ace2b52cc n=1 Tax=Sclerotinia trifoliorum TaxID=28548 RepID=A0A8H2VW15_9HELO|nr:9020f4f8-5cef-4532-9d75-499ace2b52cc [Sclerotinia trifoliorum]
MSNDIYRLPQCTCSAFFPTSDALNAHFNEYRARESYLSGQLEIYRSRSKAHDEEDGPNVYENDDNPEIKHNNGDKMHNCPLKECYRKVPFKTQQRLRRHFEQLKSFVDFI